eukprot:8225795-Ditylum_brightwellii.AAC.1
MISNIPGLVGSKTGSKLTQCKMQNGEQNIEFDIKILTKEGVIFAAYIQQDTGTETANTGTE